VSALVVETRNVHKFNSVDETRDTQILKKFLGHEMYSLSGRCWNLSYSVSSFSCDQVNTYLHVVFETKILQPLKYFLGKVM